MAVREQMEQIVEPSFQEPSCSQVQTRGSDRTVVGFWIYSFEFLKNLTSVISEWLLCPTLGERNGWVLAT